MATLLGTYIKRKREARGMSLRDFAYECGLSHTHIDSIEKGVDFRTGKSVRLTNETIQKLAKALDNGESTLFSLSLNSVCDKFSFYYDSYEREDMKSENFAIIDDLSTTTENQIIAAENIFKAYYSRSIEANNFDLLHVNFEEYVAMLLNQEHWKTRLNEKLYNSLVSIYGTLPGIDNGKTYYWATLPLPEGAIPVDLSTFIKVPVYGEVSAGNGCLAEDNIIGYELVSPGSINKYETIFFLKVKGDSMEPQICEGDFALIQKQTSVDSGSLAVVIVDDENGVIKKVNYGDDWIELVSFNPYYPIRRFEGTDVQRIRVVGLVKEIKRKFN